MGFFEFWICHMGIYLSGGDRGMSEEFLDDTDISTVRQKGGSKTVTQCMSMKVFEYSRFESVLFNHIRDKKSCESYARISELYQRNIFLIKVVSDKEWTKSIISCLKILLYRIFRFLCEIDDPHFVSFSSDGKFECFEIYIFLIQCCELWYTEASRINTLTYRIVTFSLDGFSLDRLKKSKNFIIGQEGNFTIGRFEEIEYSRIDAGNLFFF